jgi:hypothetical protein
MKTEDLDDLVMGLYLCMVVPFAMALVYNTFN